DINVAALADGLAVIHGFEHGEAARMLLHLTRQRIEIARALMSAERLPCGKGFARGCNRSIDVSSSGVRHIGDLLASRGIAGCEILAARRLAPFTVDIVAELAPMPVEPRCGLLGIFRRRPVLHAVELFHNCVAHACSPYAMG